MKLTKIVVGCDLSPSSDEALERAVAIAAHHQAVVVLVHAQANDAPIAEVDNAMLEQIGEVSAAVRVEEARQIADRLKAISVMGVQTVLMSRVGPADEIIANAAKEHAAELIVLGSTGHTGITRLLLGSVASSTIRQSECDVLVVRGAPRKALFGKPLVATDFSPASEKALAHAAAICEAGSPMAVVHAWELPAGSWGASLLGQARFPWNMVRDGVLAGAKTQAQKLEAHYAALGHTISVEMVQGPPASVITTAAEKNGHDLIAVGAHGHRGVRRLLLGSVAESTVRGSPCSVLVVHGDGHHPPQH